MKNYQKHTIILLLISFLFSTEINGNGTTAANFLEMDIGSAATAMGGAYVSVANDISAAYWNPAGLAYVKNRQAIFMYQPWVLGISNLYTGVAINYRYYGTLAVTMNYLDYGDEAVTTVSEPEGNGEMYSASEFAATISYGRRLVNWFSFGASAKYVSSSIWHSNASAMAFDFGALVTTGFFSPTGNNNQGMKIGMSISNYGTRMKYDGIDLMFPIDPYATNGNFANVEGQFQTSEWELPLIFRLGFSVQPIYAEKFTWLLAVDALHPNNNNESINIGNEFAVTFPGKASFFIRLGYKGIGLKDSEYGLTGGAGLRYFMSDNNFFDLDYTYKTIGILGDVHLYTIKFSF